MWQFIFVLVKVLSDENGIDYHLRFFVPLRQAAKLAGSLILKEAISGKLLKLISQISDLLVMKVMRNSNFVITYDRF